MLEGHTQRRGYPGLQGGERDINDITSNVWHEVHTPDAAV